MKLPRIRYALCLLSVIGLTACFQDRPTREVPSISPSPILSPTQKPSPSLSPTLLPAPTTATPYAMPSPTPSVIATPIITTASLSLVIPVIGVRNEQLHDTFNEARSEGRTHEAIDVIAPQNAKVVAAANGTIVKLFTSEKGGITIYQLSADQQWVFYYAHLNQYADGLTEKQQVRQGDVIGYVGDTGNAQPGNYHLHFAIWQITNPKDFWNGTNLNPYEILRHAPMSRP